MENSKSKQIELTKRHIDYLIDLPETGMGYQKVRLIMKDNSVIENRLVFNSQYLQVYENENIDVELIDRIEIIENNTTANTL